MRGSTLFFYKVHAFSDATPICRIRHIVSSTVSQQSSIREAISYVISQSPNNWGIFPYLRSPSSCFLITKTSHQLPPPTPSRNTRFLSRDYALWSYPTSSNRASVTMETIKVLSHMFPLLGAMVQVLQYGSAGMYQRLCDVEQPSTPLPHSF